MSTSHPPDVIHVIGVPRASLFFTTLLLPCIILNTNQRTKTGAAWERGYWNGSEKEYDQSVTGTSSFSPKKPLIELGLLVWH